MFIEVDHYILILNNVPGAVAMHDLLARKNRRSSFVEAIITSSDGSDQYDIPELICLSKASKVCKRAPGSGLKRSGQNDG